MFSNWEKLNVCILWHSNKFLLLEKWSIEENFLFFHFGITICQFILFDRKLNSICLFALKNFKVNWNFKVDWMFCQIISQYNPFYIRTYKQIKMNQINEFFQTKCSNELFVPEKKKCRRETSHHAFINIYFPKKKQKQKRNMQMMVKNPTKWTALINNNKNKK